MASFFRALLLSIFQRTFLFIIFLITYGGTLFTKEIKEVECHGNHRTQLHQMPTFRREMIQPSITVKKTRALSDLK